jgi:serine acetyltransferase
MIQSKEDYKFYLEADRIALGITRKRPRLFGDEVWKFERLLRKVEYVKNCKKDILSRAYLNYIHFRLYRLSLKLGFWIPTNVFGPGLSIAFYSGPIVVNSGAKIGANCRISQCVTIGGEYRADEKSEARAPFLRRCLETVITAKSVAMYDLIRLLHSPAAVIELPKFSNKESRILNASPLSLFP